MCLHRERPAYNLLSAVMSAVRLSVRPSVFLSVVELSPAGHLISETRLPPPLLLQLTEYTMQRRSQEPSRNRRQCRMLFIIIWCIRRILHWMGLKYKQHNVRRRVGLPLPIAYRYNICWINIISHYHDNRLQRITPKCETEYVQLRGFEPLPPLKLTPSAYATMHDTDAVNYSSRVGGQRVLNVDTHCFRAFLSDLWNSHSRRGRGSPDPRPDL